MDTKFDQSEGANDLHPPISLTSLPLEILEYLIFNDKFGLSYADIENLQCCCKLFYCLINDNELQWRVKFLNRWRHCISPDNEKDVQSWRSLYKLRFYTVQKVTDAIILATAVLLHRVMTPTCISRLLGADDDEIFNTKSLSDCILDELYEICDLRSYNDDLHEFRLEALSRQRYGMELLKILRVKQQLRIWESKIEEKGGVENISLLEGLMFVETTLIPETDVRHVHVEPYMQTLTVQVLKELERVNLCLYNTYQQKSGASSSSRDGMKWEGAENGIIMECILTALLQYRKSRTSHDVKEIYYLLQFFTSWKTPCEPNSPVASSISLILLAQCLANQLGAVSEVKKCYPQIGKVVLSFPPDLNKGESRIFFDFNHPTTSSGSLLYFTSESPQYNQLLRPSETLTLVEVLLQYIELDSHGVASFYRSVELTVYLNPLNAGLTRQLMENYYNNNINLIRAKELERNLINYYEQARASYVPHDVKLVDELEIPEDIPIRDRENSLYSEVKYAVGMIMYHTRWNYDCVIYGWTPVCEASPNWIQQMGVNQLPDGPNQPFYNVLVPDGSQRYAAQENLIPHSRPSKIRHEDVGRYMKSFEQTHYLMNHALLSYYPGDEEFTVNHAHRKYSENRSDQRPTATTK